MKKIAIGCDPNAAGLKDAIVSHLADLGFECEDYGSEDPIYANVAIDVAEAVASGKHDRGILMCGTGIGMSIAANKVPGAYAALCADAYSTERSVKSNNVNIMTLGGLALGVELIDGGRFHVNLHNPRIRLIHGHGVGPVCLRRRSPGGPGTGRWAMTPD